jgi:ferredoxin-NADP reductase
MTSLSLSFWIAAGIILQLAIYLGIAFWRHWKDYQSLRSRGFEPESSATREVRPETEEAALSAWPGFRTFRVERKILEDARQTICSFDLVPEDGKPLPPFLPGQFLTFRLDIPEANGETGQIIRCYSLSNAPDPDSYRISIKRVPPPAGSALPPGRSSNFFHDQIRVGSHLHVRAPAGHFHIDRSDAPVVLIGSGIGITPMLSMLNWSLAQQKGREIWLFYGVRHGGDLMLKQHLDALAAVHPNFHLHVCFSNPRPEDVIGRDYQHQGRISVSLLRMQLSLRPYHFYICGPTRMMESLVPALEDWGVPDAYIHFEAFGPASIKRKQAPVATLPIEKTSADIMVNFAQSSKKLQWSSTTESLLEFAEANAIAIHSGCRAGSCGSCQTTILSGEVSYRQPPDFDPEPGTCLLCVCTPKTSLILEA